MPAVIVIAPRPCSNALSTRFPSACSTRGRSTRATGASSASTASERPSSSARAPKRSRTFSTTSTRSVGSGRSASVPCSARARTSRSSAIRDRRSVSSAAERIEFSNSWVVRDRRSASSSSARSVVSGVRSSWLASATKRRSRSSPSSSRASISLSVRPSRDTSSSAGGTGRRSSSDEVEISAARRRMASIGRSAAPANRYAPNEVRSKAIGPPMRKAAFRLTSVSSRLSRLSPATSTSWLPSRRRGSASMRDDSSETGNARSLTNVGPARAWASCGAVRSTCDRSVEVASRTRPSAVRTSANVLLLPVVCREPFRRTSAERSAARERRSLSNARSRSVATRSYTKRPAAARTMAIATAKNSVNRMRIGIRLMRPSAGSRPRAPSRATPRRTAGRPSRAGSARRRRSRSSGSRTRSPRRARSAAAGSASDPAGA